MKHIETIKGLLAKASDLSSTPSEREGAQRMADRLMRKYNITLPEEGLGDFSDIAGAFCDLWS